MPVAIVQKSSIKIAFAGSLRDTKLLDVLTESAVSSLTGTLKLSVPRNEYLFYFVKGSLIYATSRKKPMEKTVIDIVKYSGFISREKLVKCEKLKSKAMKTILEMLVDEGYVSMLLYSKVISTAMRLNIISAMMETDGNYSFEIKYKVNPVHGVKPIAISQLKLVDTLIKENRAAAKTLTDSIYSIVNESAAAPYLTSGLPFLHSAIAAEADFLNFFVNAANDFVEKKWSFQSFFRKDKFLNSIAVYTFRTLVTAAIIVFLYLAFMTNTLDLRNEDLSGKDFPFIRNKISDSFEAFQSGHKKTYPKAVKTKNSDDKNQKSKKQEK